MKICSECSKFRQLIVGECLIIDHLDEVGAGVVTFLSSTSSVVP